jgi:hypothetical protein
MADNPNFPVSTASVSWKDSSGNAHVRVYSCDGYNIIERCFDGSWTTGALTAPANEVSATSWPNGSSVSIRVYCTFEDKTVEWCQDDGGAWYEGAYTTQ